MESDQEKLDLITEESGCLSCLLCIAIEQFPVSFIDEHFSSTKFLALLEEWLPLMISLNKINSQVLGKHSVNRTE